MDWRNNPREKGYVVVEDKPVVFEAVPPAAPDDDDESSSLDTSDDFSTQESNKDAGAVREATVYDCLKLFAQPERLRKGDAWYCGGCKKHQQATKELNLWRLPKILVFQLKRFSYGNFLRQKLDRMIRFPTR
jgi:ubiquitin carboxyl-terminal hydrolase 4/11/15